MSKKYPDEGTFPSSIGEVLERAGIKDMGYHDKKGTPESFSASPSGISGYIFNQLPPGDSLEDQKLSDVRRTIDMKVKKVTDMGYPGDGWT